MQRSLTSKSFPFFKLKVCHNLLSLCGEIQTGWMDAVNDLLYWHTPLSTPNSPHSLVAGSFKADVVPNGERVARGPGPGAGGDGHPNGPLPPPSPPAAQGTSPTVSPHSKEPSQGVAAFPPPMLEKSEGTSAEGPVHKGDALQSLRLSMPMQETELCKHTVTCSCSECPHPPFALGCCFRGWLVDLGLPPYPNVIPFLYLLHSH